MLADIPSKLMQTGCAGMWRDVVAYRNDIGSLDVGKHDMTFDHLFPANWAILGGGEAIFADIPSKLPSGWMHPRITDDLFFAAIFLNT